MDNSLAINTTTVAQTQVDESMMTADVTSKMGVRDLSVSYRSFRAITNAGRRFTSGAPGRIGLSVMLSHVATGDQTAGCRPASPKAFCQSQY